MPLNTFCRISRRSTERARGRWISAPSIHAYAGGAISALLQPAGRVGTDTARCWQAENIIRKRKAEKGAVPGEMTSAFLALQLWLGQPKTEIDYVVVPFDEIFARTRLGKLDGLIIMKQLI